ncbi:MAG TPA: hypothetical protein VGK94_03280 [Candidatus Polarisedimenticolia bacterium]
MKESECRHPANALLPWFVRRTLQQDEMEWVRSHVESCTVCTSECEELAEAAAEDSAGPAPGDQRAMPPPRARRWATCRPYLLVAALAPPALLGAWWVYLGLPGIVGVDLPRLSPALYLDLASGPSRAVEPLASVVLRSGIESVVLSFLPPLIEQAHLAFDLQGPHGAVIVRGEPIERVDEEGRCSFSLPALLLEPPGDYAVVVREESALGEVRLYPFPFRVEKESATDAWKARPPGGAPSLSSGDQ